MMLCLLAALSLAGVTACQRKDALSEDKTGILKSVRLSLSVGATPKTKMDTGVLTELAETSPAFTGLTDIQMVAFDREGSVLASDQALNVPIAVPEFNALNYPNAAANFYPGGVDTFLPIGAASVLLYGRAPGNDKHVSGSLIPQGFDTQNTTAQASSLGFIPDVMYPGSDIPMEATLIARVVNSIMLGAPIRINGQYQRGTELVNTQV